jgi:hypothetical protein
MRCWNLRCEIALLCGALAGTLSPAQRRAGGSSGTESLAHEALCRGGTAATKTDAIDALGTAQFAATKRPPAAQLPDSATEELRELGKPSNPSNL